MKVILVLSAAMVMANAAFANVPSFNYSDLRNVNFDMSRITRWYYGKMDRGDYYEKRMVPQRLNDGYRIRICSGTGCPIKIPFTVTRQHLDIVRQAVEKARSSSSCNAGAAACERNVDLRVAVRTLEAIVWREKILTMSYEELKKYYAEGLAGRPNFGLGGDRTEPGLSQQRTMDCVDQASNGTTYLIVLNEEGYMRRNHVINPGMENFLIQPHFFSRIQDNESGARFQFDLYDRSNTSANRTYPLVRERSDNHEKLD
ncbi:MAG TPA: hypothetical protein VIH99_08950 [Bdellovibrionota bacterium]|jgi:hypothetical protein